MSSIPAIEPYALPTPGDLPPNVADWSVDAERAVLLVHDMQRYFVAPFADVLRDELVGNAAALRRRCASLGIPVAYTAQPGDMSTAQRGLLADFWGQGMRVDPRDRLVVDELTPGPHDWSLTKWRYSAFVHSDLLRRLADAGRDQVVLCGVYGHVGVLATAIDAFSHDIQPFLVADAIADFSPVYHRMTLDYAAERCAVVTTTKEVLP